MASREDGALFDCGFTVRPETARRPEVLRGAIQKGNLKAVEYLLNCGWDVNACPSQTDLLSPLHIAVQNKYEEVAQLLIRYKADVNATDRDGRPPIFYAVDNVDLRMTHLLLSNGANVKDFPEVFHAAVRRNSVEIAELLLPHGVDVNVDAFGKTAPHSYVEENEKSSDIETLERQCQRLRDRLAYYKAEVKSLATPLYVSVEKASASMVDFLLRHNANVNAADEFGLTPLHLSASRGNVDICRKLLERGARVNAASENRDTALHFAVITSHEEVVQLLIESGADVNFKRETGEAPLHRAAEEGNTGIFVALLKSGADVNSRAWFGRTPLHYYCKKGDAKSVEALLDYGADMRITCDMRLTPLDVASKEGDFYRNMPRHIGSEKFDDTVDLLHRHKLKLEIAGFKAWHEKSMPIERKLPVGFRSLCESELSKMANEFIDGTTVSYCDILKKDLRSLVKLMSNENIVLASKQEEDYRKRFPMYAGVIKGQFQRGLARFELLKPAARVFCSFIDLPDYCAEKILEYLSDSDLRALVAVRSAKALKS